MWNVWEKVQWKEESREVKRPVDVDERIETGLNYFPP